MKRALSPEVGPPGKRLCDGQLQSNHEAIASLVRLNVGGRHFDVSPETLSGAAPRLFVELFLFPN